MSVSGLPEFIRALTAVEVRLRKQLAAELFREGEEIIGLAKEKYVPVDLGILRSSGFVEPPDGLSVEIGFGGPAAPYALAQHENMNFNHTTGGPKYLERPAVERASGMGQRIAGRMRLR